MTDERQTTRRVLLRTGGLAVAVATAGCTVEVGGRKFIIGGDTESEGGDARSPTATPTERPLSTPTQTPTSTSTETPESADTSTEEPNSTSGSGTHRYGEQGYGEFGYGGVAP